MDGCLGLFLDEQLAVALNPLTVFLFFFFFFFFVVALEHANSGWCEGDAAAGVTAHRAVRVSTTSTIFVSWRRDVALLTLRSQVATSRQGRWVSLIRRRFLEAA